MAKTPDIPSFDLNIHSSLPEALLDKHSITAQSKDNLEDQPVDDVPDFYRISLSSLPLSSLPSDDDHDHTPRRVPRRSPHNLESSSTTDRSELSRTLTPRLARTARSRVSPRPRTKTRQQERDDIEHPLVLLHVTLLPPILPWSQEHVAGILQDSLLDLSLIHI